MNLVSRSVCALQRFIFRNATALEMAVPYLAWALRLYVCKTDLSADHSVTSLRARSF
jgi:hypothetical protein